jgi:pimeloyl-ACP methyl ester carboxylesterase
MSNPVVLVHGLASSYQHGWADDGWPEILADEGREVIGGDLPGHGTSSKPTDPAAYENLEESVLESFKDRGQVDAIGFSLGARILLTLATRQPERFGRLVLMGIGDNVFQTDHGEALADVLENGTPSEEIGMRVFDRMAADPRNDRAALAALMRRPAPVLDEAALGQVRCPVLVILGEKDFVGPADRLVAALPHATLRVVTGIDHFATPKAFDSIDAAVRFLTVDSAVSSNSAES